ncbi:hypothetical protein C0995_012120 [Termitomyces sp. Mi166|nr:hypothetical protein C0995_012120 [Termitomyces sp. Mi166\
METPVLTEPSSLPNMVTDIHSPELPAEILPLIFGRAIAPKFLLDPSLNPCLDSPWRKAIEMALSISTVCKTWHFAGIPFIYESVVFRHLGQIPAFLRTIEMAPFKYQNLVKEVTVYAFVRPYFGASFSKYLQKIIDNCPSLTSLGFLSPLALPSTITLPTLHSGITQLSLTDIATPTIFRLIDSARDTLVSIHLRVVTPMETGTGINETILLPHLRDLSIIVGFEQSPLDWMIQLLLVPGLQKFVYASFPFLMHRDRNCQQLASFLKTNGSQIHFLQLQSAYGQFGEDVQELLDACPLLQHLGLFPGAVMNVSHSTIKWLDVGPLNSACKNTEAWTMSSARAAFPNLQGFREMFGPNEILRTIPTTMPPDSIMPSDATFDLIYPGIELQSRPGAVRIRRFIDYLEYFEDTSTDSDSNYTSDDSSCSSGEYTDTTESVSVRSLDDLLYHFCNVNSSE